MGLRKKQQPHIKKCSGNLLPCSDERHRLFGVVGTEVPLTSVIEPSIKSVSGLCYASGLSNLFSGVNNLIVYFGTTVRVKRNSYAAPPSLVIVTTLPSASSSSSNSMSMLTGSPDPLYEMLYALLGSALCTTMFSV